MLFNSPKGLDVPARGKPRTPWKAQGLGKPTPASAAAPRGRDPGEKSPPPRRRREGWLSRFRFAGHETGANSPRALQGAILRGWRQVPGRRFARPGLQNGRPSGVEGQVDSDLRLKGAPLGLFFMTN